jgi:hypothetical protein
MSVSVQQTQLADSAYISVAKGVCGISIATCSCAVVAVDCSMPVHAMDCKACWVVSLRLSR